MGWLVMLNKLYITNITIDQNMVIFFRLFEAKIKYYRFPPLIGGNGVILLVILVILR
jgi:hypothetical protein